VRKIQLKGDGIVLDIDARASDVFTITVTDEDSQKGYVLISANKGQLEHTMLPVLVIDYDLYTNFMRWYDSASMTEVVPMVRSLMVALEMERTPEHDRVLEAVKSF